LGYTCDTHNYFRVRINCDTVIDYKNDRNTGRHRNFLVRTSPYNFAYIMYLMIYNVSNANSVAGGDRVK
jgi:hypothetical protein